MNVQFKKREIQWPRVVAFHKEIARRAEESFFAIPLGKTPSDRWSSIRSFEPEDFSGNWYFSDNDLQSTSFRNMLHSGTLGEMFIGGPCWVRSKKEENHWRQEWCPFLYRSISLDPQEDGYFRMVPEQGRWEVSPIVHGVLDRKGFFPRKPIDELISEVLEASSASAQAMNQPLTTCLIEVLCREFPDFTELFARDVDSRSSSHAPTQWIIFSPPPTGPLTQNLVHDYDSLSKIVNDSSKSVGGLCLFEGFPDQEPSVNREPTPIVPLNDSQRAAVRGILESKPVTVISGPPGCGKSQVVLSLMLNAWQHGISVLFASNNNQAVDVIRERLQRFESHFPIAMRAGSKKKSNIIQALADTLNYITGKKGSAQNPKEGATAKCDELLAKQSSLQQFLGSNLPQRVDEAVRSALGAYATYQQTLAEIGARKETLLAEFLTYGAKTRPEAFHRDVVIPFEKWLSRIPHYENLLQQDDNMRKRLMLELTSANETRARAGQRAGLDSTSITSWSWLVSGQGPELLRSWHERLKQVLAKPLEQFLSPYEWTTDFERWNGEEEAKVWAASAKKLSSDIRNACGQLGPKLVQVKSVKCQYDLQLVRIKKCGIPPEITVDPSTLSEWSEAYALKLSLPSERVDWLPWSQRSRAIRRMKKAEKSLRASFPLLVWRNIGKLTLDGRDKLSKIVEQAQMWLAMRAEWNTTETLRNEIDRILGALRGKCAELTAHENVPDSPDLNKWQEVSQALLEMFLCADRATVAWRKRTLAENTKAEIRAITSDFMTIGSGVPIREAWAKSLGASFHELQS